MQYPYETPLDPIPSPPVLPASSSLYLTGMAAGELFHDIVHTYQQESKAPLTLCIQAALGIGAFLQQGLVFRSVNSLAYIGYNKGSLISNNRFPLCPSQQPRLI